MLLMTLNFKLEVLIPLLQKGKTVALSRSKFRRIASVAASVQASAIVAHVSVLLEWKIVLLGCSTISFASPFITNIIFNKPFLSSSCTWIEIPWRQKLYLFIARGWPRVRVICSTTYVASNSICKLLVIASSALHCLTLLWLATDQAAAAALVELLFWIYRLEWWFAFYNVLFFGGLFRNGLLVSLLWQKMWGLVREIRCIILGITVGRRRLLLEWMFESILYVFTTVI